MDVPQRKRLLHIGWVPTHSRPYGKSVSSVDPGDRVWVRDHLGWNWATHFPAFAHLSLSLIMSAFTECLRPLGLLGVWFTFHDCDIHLHPWHMQFTLIHFPLVSATVSPGKIQLFPAYFPLLKILLPPPVVALLRKLKKQVYITVWGCSWISAFLSLFSHFRRGRSTIQRDFDIRLFKRKTSL